MLKVATGESFAILFATNFTCTTRIFVAARRTVQYFAKEPFDATVTAFAPLPARDHCNHQSLLLQPLLLMLPEMLVHHTVLV